MAPIQHTVFFKFPDLDPSNDEIYGLLTSVVSKFNQLRGISAELFSYGGISDDGQLLAKEAFLDRVSWPDKSNGFTHCLFVVASGTSALRNYLHSSCHLTDWMRLVKPFTQGIVVFDNEMVLTEDQIARAQIIHPVLFKLPDIDGLVPPELATIIDKFDSMPGISATFRPYGAAGMTHGELLSTCEWPDKSEGYTHSLLVLAESVTDLKAYLHSDYHKKEWFPAVAPYMKDIIVFDAVFTPAVFEPRHHPGWQLGTVAFFGAAFVATIAVLFAYLSTKREKLQ